MPYGTEVCRGTHSGTIPEKGAPGGWINPGCIDDYLVAQHLVRSYDFVVTDCLTGQPARWFGKDHILMDAMLASRDPIANDTVGALFGGYEPESIEYLALGRLYGLGTDQPARIRLAGLSAFSEQRRRVYDRYHADGKYPFKDDYAGARVLESLEPPAGVTTSDPEPVGGGVVSVPYQVQGDGKLSRIDLLVDGRPVAHSGSEPAASGAIEVDLTRVEGGSRTFQVAAWDRALNCVLSEARPLQVREARAAGGAPPAAPVPAVAAAPVSTPVAMAAKLTATRQPPALLTDKTVLDPSKGVSFQSEGKVKEGSFAMQFALVQSFEPLRYQWRKDGADIPGATEASLFMPCVTREDAGSYTCVASNSIGSVETASSTVTVLDGPEKPQPVAAPPTALESASFAGMQFVKIPAGAFEMGSLEDEPRRQRDEGPRRQVRISRGFWMGRCPVAKAEWRSIMNGAPWLETRLVADLAEGPAEWISWDDARALIARLNQRGEGSFRLPTEAEWEYACRAGSTTQYQFGDAVDLKELGEHAWYARNADVVGRKYAHPVGTRRPNAWGLYDMIGNVWEWCSDFYGADAYARGSAVDPVGPASGVKRVVRGGCWYDDERLLRSAHRHAQYPSYRIVGVGMRLVREV
jgi:formylglycine-generating enzyme required for sulfatase activity